MVMPNVGGKRPPGARQNHKTLVTRNQPGSVRGTLARPPGARQNPKTLVPQKPAGQKNHRQHNLYDPKGPNQPLSLIVFNYSHSCCLEVGIYAHDWQVQHLFAGYDGLVHPGMRTSVLEASVVCLS